MSYLYEAVQLANEYKEVDLYHEVFEGAALDAINAQNAQISGKSESLLSKCAKVIRGIINKVKEIVGNIFAWFKADDAEKDKFKKFREECSRNPEFAKKKITLTLNLDDTRIIDEDDEIDNVKDEMLADMHDYVTHMTFEDFCNECDIEIEDLKDE